MNLRRFFVTLLVLSIQQQAVAKSQEPVWAGTVKTQSGNPLVLRNPVKQVIPSWKQAVEEKGLMIVQFQELHWEAGPLLNGARLYYGDYILTRANAVATIMLQDGMKLSVVSGSSIRISRTELSTKKKTLIENWITIFNGKIRAMVEQKRNDGNYTKFRTHSVAMGVRGTDFVIEESGTESKVLTIEGEVAVRQVSSEENAAFEVLNKGLAAPEDKAEMTRAADLLAKSAAAAPEVFVKKGMKVEAVAANNADVKSVAAKLVTTQISKQEVQSLKEMNSSLGGLSGEAENQNLSDLVAEVESKDVGEKMAEALPRAAPVAVVRHSVWASATSLTYDVRYSENDYIALRSLGASVDYRYSPWRFLDIGFHISYLPNFSTEYEGDTSSYSEVDVEGGVILAAVRAAAKAQLGAFTGGIGFSLLRSSSIEMRFASYQDAHARFEMEYQPMLSLFLGYTLKDKIQLGLEIGGTDVQFRAESSDDRNYLVDTNPEQGVSILRLGAGWGF
jgi:hypothetical protein